MARAKLKYKSRKEQDAALQGAYAQLARAMGSIREREQGDFADTKGPNKYERSQVRAIMTNDLFGEYPVKQVKFMVGAKRDLREAQLYEAYQKRTNAIMNANVGG